MSIFYCPKCNKLESNFNGNNYKTLWANSRDGWGRGIYHIACPNCGYKLSGYMNLEEADLIYVKDVISMYSDKDFVDVDKILIKI